jgi:branched-chain amino acid aminotransferase
MTYLRLPWTDAEIVARIRGAYDASKLREAYVRLVISRGAGPMTLLPDQCAAPSMIVYVMPLVVPTAEAERGISVVVPERLRNDRRSLAPAAKTGNYLNNALALVEAKRAGGDDAVMVNPEGFVTEATTANVFWAKAGRVVTPSHDCGILAGITREALIASIRAAGIPVAEGRFPAADFRACDEAFLTGTIRGVSPIVRIDGRAVGDGKPGPLTRRIGALNDRAIESLAADW